VLGGLKKFLFFGRSILISTNPCATQNIDEPVPAMKPPSIKNVAVGKIFAIAKMVKPIPPTMKDILISVQ
jgi:hypothetical protein